MFGRPALMGLCLIWQPAIVFICNICCRHLFDKSLSLSLSPAKLTMGLESHSHTICRITTVWTHKVVIFNKIYLLHFCKQESIIEIIEIYSQGYDIQIHVWFFWYASVYHLPTMYFLQGADKPIGHNCSVSRHRCQQWTLYVCSSEVDIQSATIDCCHTMTT